MTTVLRVVLESGDRKIDFPNTSFWMTVYRGRLPEVAVPTELHSSVEGILGRLRDLAVNSCTTISLDERFQEAFCPAISQAIEEGVARINRDINPHLLDPELLSTGKRGVREAHPGIVPDQSLPVSDTLR